MNRLFQVSSSARIYNSNIPSCDAINKFITRDKFIPYWTCQIIIESNLNMLKSNILQHFPKNTLKEKESNKNEVDYHSKIHSNEKFIERKVKFVFNN